MRDIAHVEDALHVVFHCFCDPSTAPWRLRTRGSLRALERGHDVLGEPGELLLEFFRWQALGPMEHEVFEPRIFVSHRLDAVDNMGRWAAEPRLLPDAVAQRGHAGRRSGRAPGAPMLGRVADEPEGR